LSYGRRAKKLEWSGIGPDDAFNNFTNPLNPLKANVKYISHGVDVNCSGRSSFLQAKPLTLLLKEKKICYIMVC